jgi:hypothetical protein
MGVELGPSTMNLDWKVFENRALGIMFGPTRDEIKVGWRKLQSKKLRNFHSSPNIRITKSRKIKWAGYVACMRQGRRRMHIGFW